MIKRTKHDVSYGFWAASNFRPILCEFLRMFAHAVRAHWKSSTIFAAKCEISKRSLAVQIQIGERCRRLFVLKMRLKWKEKKRKQPASNKNKKRKKSVNTSTPYKWHLTIDCVSRKSRDFSQINMSWYQSRWIKLQSMPCWFFVSHKIYCGIFPLRHYILLGIFSLSCSMYFNPTSLLVRWENEWFKYATYRPPDQVKLNPKQKIQMIKKYQFRICFWIWMHSQSIFLGKMAFHF